MGDRRGVDAWASPEGKLALVPIHFVTGTGRAMDERLKRVINHSTQKGSRQLWSFSPWGFLHYLHYLHCFLIVLVRCLSVKTPLFKCEVYFAGIVEGKRYMGVFPLFPLIPLFFDGTERHYNRKNSFVKVRGSWFVPDAQLLRYARFARIAVFFDSAYQEDWLQIQVVNVHFLHFDAIEDIIAQMFYNTKSGLLAVLNRPSKDSCPPVWRPSVRSLAQPGDPREQGFM